MSGGRTVELRADEDQRRRLPKLRRTSQLFGQSCLFWTFKGCLCFVSCLMELGAKLKPLSTVNGLRLT